MAVSRRRRRRRFAPIGFGALVLALLPNTIGFQDLGALLARQPAVAGARARAPDRVAIRHHPRRHVQPAASDRHHHPASAALCAGEFRSDRHHRFDRRRSLSAIRMRRCNFPRSIARPSATRCWRVRASRCRRCRRSCHRAGAAGGSRCAAQERGSRAAASIPIRNMNSPRFRTSESAHPMSICPMSICRRPAHRARCKDGARVFFGADPLARGAGTDRALGARRGAGGDGVAHVRRSRHQAIGARAAGTGR